jgi:hypothetical protein
VSCDTAGLLGPRKANGDLPDIDFMHPAGGKYIDKVIDVDLPYNGDAPDLGAFEEGEVTVIAGPIRKKISVKTYTSTATEFYTISGRRVFPKGNSMLLKTTLYIIRQSGAAPQRTTMMLHIR